MIHKEGCFFIEGKEQPLVFIDSNNRRAIMPEV